MFGLLAWKLKDRRNPPFDFAIVDEAQDISVAQLRFLAALGDQRPNSLFFAGDLGQRIFQTPFSWKALGVDVRGRSQTLKLNYRTSHHIRMQADRLLGPEVADVDGHVEDRRGTVSAFNGEPPAIRLFQTEQEEGEAVGTWLQERRDEGVDAREMGIFVRSAKVLDRARGAVRHRRGLSGALVPQFRPREPHGRSARCLVHLRLAVARRLGRHPRRVSRPKLTPPERSVARAKGWILGVPGLIAGSI